MMRPAGLLVSCALLLIFIQATVTAKDSWTIFRHGLANYVYEKAVKKYDDKKTITRIRDELIKFDELLMSAKGSDDAFDDSMAKSRLADVASIERKLVSFLTKFDLDSAVHAYRSKILARKDKAASWNAEDFEDERIQKLWAAAKEARFTESEMKLLFEELTDHDARRRTYEQNAAEVASSPHENDVHHQADEEHLERLKGLKVEHKELVADYDRLRSKILDESTSPFTKDQARLLWKIAQENKNFTSTELQTIKEELWHFEKQIQKLEHHQDELAVRDDEKKGKAKTNAYFDHLENDELRERHETIKRKVNKMGLYLTQKVRHTEL